MYEYRIQVLLDDDILARLQALGKLRRASLSQMGREAIEVYLSLPSIVALLRGGIVAVMDDETKKMPVENLPKPTPTPRSSGGEELDVLFESGDTPPIIPTKRSLGLAMPDLPIDKVKRKGKGKR